MAKRTHRIQLMDTEWCQVSEVSFEHGTNVYRDDIKRFVDRAATYDRYHHILFDGKPMSLAGFLNMWLALTPDESPVSWDMVDTSV